MKIVDKCKALDRPANASICSNQKNAAQGGEVLFVKMQTSRIFTPCNILPLVDPPLAVEGGREQLVKVKSL